MKDEIEIGKVTGRKDLLESEFYENLEEVTILEIESFALFIILFFPSVSLFAIFLWPANSSTFLPSTVKDELKQ